MLSDEREVMMAALECESLTHYSRLRLENSLNVTRSCGDAVRLITRRNAVKASCEIGGAMLSDEREVMMAALGCKSLTH